MPRVTTITSTAAMRGQAHWPIPLWAAASTTDMVRAVWSFGEVGEKRARRLLRNSGTNAGAKLASRAGWSGVDGVGEGVAVEDDAVAGRIGRGEVAVLDPDRLDQSAEVGERAAVDVFEDVGVGQAAEELAGELHHEVRGERHAEGARERRDLEIGRDAADADHVGLHEITGAAREEVAELLERVDVLADRERASDQGAQARVVQATLDALRTAPGGTRSGPERMGADPM
jgi:hypothetical protein